MVRKDEINTADIFKATVISIVNAFTIRNGIEGAILTGKIRLREVGSWNPGQG